MMGKGALASHVRLSSQVVIFQTAPTMCWYCTRIPCTGVHVSSVHNLMSQNINHIHLCCTPTLLYCSRASCTGLQYSCTPVLYIYAPILFLGSNVGVGGLVPAGITTRSGTERTLATRTSSAPICLPVSHAVCFHR